MLYFDESYQVWTNSSIYVYKSGKDMTNVDILRVLSQDGLCN